MADLTDIFLIELLNGIREKKALACPVFVEDSVAWSRILRTADRWRVQPLLNAKLRESSWFQLLPESTLLFLDERRARSELLAAALREEAESVIRALSHERVEVAILGELALRNQLRCDVLSDSREIEIACSRPRDALLVLGKRGYRATGLPKQEFVELKHRASINRVRIHLIADEAMWSRVERGFFCRIPVLSFHREDLAARIVRAGDWTLSPERLIQLQAVHVQARELAALASPEQQEAWLTEFPVQPERWFSGMSKLFRAWTRSAQTS